MTSNGIFDENAIAKAIDAASPIDTEEAIKAAISELRITTGQVRPLLLGALLQFGFLRW
jgi:hypothetical protein